MVSAGSTSCPAYGAFEHGTITRSAPGLSENAERSMPRSRLRLAAVFAGLLAALVAIVAVAIALTQSQQGEAEDMAIPSISLDAPARPNELLSLSAAAREVMLAEYSALADSSVSSLKPVVNPFPDVRYNVFDPKPTMPHHRWTKRELREQARRLILLVREASRWEDAKNAREQHLAKRDADYQAEVLSNITRIEADYKTATEILQKHLKAAEDKIGSAALVTDHLQIIQEHKEDVMTDKVWTILGLASQQLHWDEKLQAIKDQQIKRDMESDGKMNYVMVKRYNTDVEDEKQRLGEWIIGLRGRVHKNMTYLNEQEAKLLAEYNNLHQNEIMHFEEAYSKFDHLNQLAQKGVDEGNELDALAKDSEVEEEGEEGKMKSAIETAKTVSIGVEALDQHMQDQHEQDFGHMDQMFEKYDALKSILSMLVTSLHTVESVLQKEQAAHSLLKEEENWQMANLKSAVEKLKPKLQSILDLDGSVKTLQAGAQSNIDSALQHFDGIKTMQDKLDQDRADLLDTFKFVNDSTTENQKSVEEIHTDISSGYADINAFVEPAQLQITSVNSMYAALNRTKKDLVSWAEGLEAKVALMQEKRTKWTTAATQAVVNLEEKTNTQVEQEQTKIQGWFGNLKSIKDEIEKAKAFKESSLALQNSLRQQLAQTTQALEDLNKKFSDAYSAIGLKVDELQKGFVDIASPETIKQGEDSTDINAQKILDSTGKVRQNANYVKERENSESDRLRTLEEKLANVRKEVNLAIMRAKELLGRHPNLFERISCVCYDGDKLVGKCIVGSMADTSICDVCPAGSYCVRGKEYPCKTTCPGGMVLVGSCPAGSVSDITTCTPSPAGFFSPLGQAFPCKTSCDPGFELRGACPLGSSADTTRCQQCPAGFFCQNGKTQACQTSCKAGLVLTGKCDLGSSNDVITCQPSPAGYYSEVGVAIPCKQTCDAGMYITNECPAGSTRDTTKCSRCPEGSFCQKGLAIPCKTSCEDGMELTGSCAAGSTEDVTVCMRCNEGNFCKNGKAIPCKTTCAAGNYLEGRCRKGSTEDTTVCKVCKGDFFCANGVMTPCKKDCQPGSTLEGKCLPGSTSDTTVCTLCPGDFYCGSFFDKLPCQTSCWEGKVLQGKCPAGSTKDVTTCDACPEGNYCQKGKMYKCGKVCGDGTLLVGHCPEKSADDKTSCDPCPAGFFCKDGKVALCKTTCPDGQLLQGFCRAGSMTDVSVCVPCPKGSFCVGGKAQECVNSCPNGQTVVGTCEQGSSTAITKCNPCPAGSFCRDNQLQACKTTCPAGQYLQGMCDAGSSTDKTSCLTCPDNFFCVDGKQQKCKQTCPPGQRLNGSCKGGSPSDISTCDPCPPGSYCKDGLVFPCKSKASCSIGQQFVGECAAGSDSDGTRCDPCPPGSYCRDGVATPCRTMIDCPDCHKIDGSCPEGSSLNTICKPCRAGVFCAAGVEAPCKATCGPGNVLQGFCGSGSSADSTTCEPVPAGSYSLDGVAIPCLTTCPAGQMLSGSCPAGGTADGMSCIPCPEGLWCKNGLSLPCKSGCLNGKLLSGSCSAGSTSDTTACNPCPAGSFCVDKKVNPCKSICPDGKFLDGKCDPGSSEDTSRCVPCPSGVFCIGTTRTPCQTTCPAGQILQGFCAAGSTQDTTSCAPCPSGSFCNDGIARPCKTTCDDGEVFLGKCLEGSAKDTTTCSVCPAGFYCRDGMQAPCTKSCPPDFSLEGECKPGSVADNMCVSNTTPLPLRVFWFRMKRSSANVGEQMMGMVSDTMASETRFSGRVGETGTIEGLVKMPLRGGKWCLQFDVFWPAYDAKKGIKVMDRETYPLQAFGPQVQDVITATMNGQVIPLDMPRDDKGQPVLPGRTYFMINFVGDELVWRFEFTSKTPEILARPFLVSGEVTILRDGTTGDQGIGAKTGSGSLSGVILNAEDGKKLSDGLTTHDGYSTKGIAVGGEATLLLFKVPVKSGKYSMNLEDGDYTCICIFKGFFSYYNPYCSVKGGLKKSIDMVMSPFVGPGTIRIILTWNDKVNDLDAYLMAPFVVSTAEDQKAKCEVSWIDRSCEGDSVTFDLDQKQGYGPETITARHLRPGRYRFRVNEYRPMEGADVVKRLLSSEAQVRVESATGLKIYKIGLPGNGFIKGGSWYVFAIDGGSDTLNVCTPDTCGIGDVYEKKATAVYEFK